ncbi:fungal-specific transcription factor domain-containing protein [Dichotomocladium elegans]|nr:fungal-specific transcription factor domain-containing protein [Dichotomocladium elegans]
MDPLKDSKHKRLKVGRACYTCRAKKIKCDGLRPCMQCKARSRPCTFYKDGSFDPDQEIPNNSATVQCETRIVTPDNNNRNHSSSSSSSTSSSTIPAFTAGASADYYAGGHPEESGDSYYLFADTKDSNYTRSKRRGAPLESRTSNLLASLGENLRKVSLYDNHTGKTFLDIEPFGSFIKWVPEPPLPSRYMGSIEMPSREAQMELLEQHFGDHYESLPIIPKRFFFDQLRSKGPFITPLLLNAIYALASRFSTNPSLPKSDVFYHRAKRLLDDFMDVPRVSTVIALCYMSLYEPTPPIHRNKSPYCRAWIYSGMAFRMCLELGLHNESNISKELQQDNIELRKRVYWSCYFLDKFQSSGWERPWMLLSHLSNVHLPSELPDDDEHERHMLQCFIEKVKYAQRLEARLAEAWNSPHQHGAAKLQNNNNFGGGTSNSSSRSNSSSSSSNSNNSNSSSSNIDKSKDDVYSHRFSEVLRKFPPELQWTPTSILSVDEVIRLPAPPPWVAHLHIHYNISILHELFRAPNNAFNQFQRRVTAACMTQLVDFVCDRPRSVIKFDFLMLAVLAAMKVHVRHLYSADVNIARQSWSLFEKCIMIVHKIQKFAVIPNASKFLQNFSNGVDGVSLHSGLAWPIEGPGKSNTDGQSQQLQQQSMMNMAAIATSQSPSSMAPTASNQLGDMYINMDRPTAIAAATEGFHQEQSGNAYVVLSMNCHSQHDWSNMPHVLQQQQPSAAPGPIPLQVDQGISQHMPGIGRRGSDIIQLPSELMIQPSHGTSATAVNGTVHPLFNVPGTSQHSQEHQHHLHHHPPWNYHQE